MESRPLRRSSQTLTVAPLRAPTSSSRPLTRAATSARTTPRQAHQPRRPHPAPGGGRGRQVRRRRAPLASRRLCPPHRRRRRLACQLHDHFPVGQPDLRRRGPRGAMRPRARLPTPHCFFQFHTLAYFVEVSHRYHIFDSGLPVPVESTPLALASRYCQRQWYRYLKDLAGMSRALSTRG
jgi:hypothetical protein